jgi:SAM-dependent methyltransferase
MESYYARKLSAERLALCYKVAPPRVVQYLNAEIEYSQHLINSGDRVLELGCGYGRVLKEIARTGCTIIGIDISLESLVWGKINGYCFPAVVMDSSLLGFQEDTFDCVLCIQNGLSAFKTEPSAIIAETLRVVKPGGIAVFSSYSDNFWTDRLEWFRIQSRFGLVGEIDEEKTCDGRIVCKDGFVATTIRPADLLSITKKLGVNVIIKEVDRSSIFFIIQVS